jgi:hypothetical protein
MKRSILLTVIAVVSIGTLVTLNVQSHIGSDKREKQALKERIAGIDELTVTQINIDNLKGSPLVIQEAGVKEISGDDFRALTGEDSANSRLSTFPEVLLYNGSSKTIKSFAVVVESGTGKGNGLLKNISIPPYSTHKVLSSEWPRAEKVTVKNEEKFVNVMRQPGLDSAKSWIPVSASGLKVTVGFVEFEDGTEWTMPSN